MITLEQRCSKPGLYEHWFKEIYSPACTADEADCRLSGSLLQRRMFVSEQTAVVGQSEVESLQQRG